MKYLKYLQTTNDFESFKNSENYILPNVSYVVENNVVSFEPYVPKLQGVFIQHIDGTLYSEENWTSGGFSNAEANGVAVIDDNASFVIPKTQLGNKKWASDTTLVNGVVSGFRDIAKEDFSGQNNTMLISAQFSDSAATSCANYIFPNGTNGYLPALGELLVAYNYISDINAALRLIGGMTIKLDDTSWYWSSTQYSNNAWAINFNSGETTYEWKTSSYSGYDNFYIIAFTTL